MVRKLSGLLAVVGLGIALASPVSAATFEPAGSELMIKFSGLASIIIPAEPTSADNVFLLGKQGMIQTGVIWSTVGFGPGTSLFTGVPLITNFTVTVNNSVTGYMTGRVATKNYQPPGTPNPVGPGTIGLNGMLGTLPLVGSAKVALGGGLTLPAPLGVVGAGGTLQLPMGSTTTINGSVNMFSILATGGPWVTGKIVMENVTTNIISVPILGDTANGIQITGNAFTLDPDNEWEIKTMTTGGGYITTNPNGMLKVQHVVTLVGSNQISTANTGGTGHMTLVAPLRINTIGLGFGSVPGQVRLTYRFVPEPSVIALAAAGAVGLALLGHRRLK